MSGKLLESTFKCKPSEVIIEVMSKPDAHGKTLFFTNWHTIYTPSKPYPHTCAQIFRTFLEPHVESWKSRGFTVVIIDKVPS